MPDCSCKDSKDLFVLSPRSVFLPRSSSRRPYQSCSLRMLNDAEWFRVSVVNCFQYHSISFNIIQYLFSIYSKSIYIYVYIVYLCIFTLFNIYLYYIICIKLLTPATAWSLRRCWPGPGSLASQSGNVFQSSRGLSFTRRWDHEILQIPPVGLQKTLRSWEDHWKTLKTYQDISRHYEKSAAYIILYHCFEVRKEMKKRCLVSRPATSWQLGRTSPARSRTLARCRVARRRSWRQSQRPSSDPNSENRNPQNLDT